MAVSQAYIFLWGAGIVFVILPHLNLGLLSDYKICADSECASLMSRVQAIRDQRGKDCRFLSFRKGDSIFVYHKLTGKREDLWAGSIDQEFGHFPKDAVVEEQVYVTSEKIVETQESDFFCMDEYGNIIDSSHLDPDYEGDDSDQIIPIQESETTQTSPNTDDTNAGSPATPEDVSTESPPPAPESEGESAGENEEKNDGDEGAGTDEEEHETPAAPNEQGGSPSSSWLSSSVTGWLGLGEEEEAGNVVDEEKKDEIEETQAEGSYTSSMMGWVGLGGGGGGEPDDAKESSNSQEEDGETADSFTSTMTGWLGYGSDKKTEQEHDEEVETDEEEEQAEKFRSRKLSLDLEANQLQGEEETEEMGTLGWLGSGLSSTLGFGLTNQESEEGGEGGEDEETSQKEEEQPASSSWLDLGITDMLGFGKDKNEENEETEEDETLKEPTDSQNVVDTSQSQPAPTDEAKTEPSLERLEEEEKVATKTEPVLEAETREKTTETQLDQNLPSETGSTASVDVDSDGKLEEKSQSMPDSSSQIGSEEEEESKILDDNANEKDVAGEVKKKEMEDEDHQMPESVGNEDEVNSKEPGEEIQTAIDRDQDFVPQNDISSGSVFSSGDLKSTGQSVSEAQEVNNDDKTENVKEEEAEVRKRIDNTEESNEMSVETGASSDDHKAEGSSKETDVLHQEIPMTLSDESAEHSRVSGGAEESSGESLPLSPDTAEEKNEPELKEDDTLTTDHLDTPAITDNNPEAETHHGELGQEFDSSHTTNESAEMHEQALEENTGTFSSHESITNQDTTMDNIHLSTVTPPMQKMEGDEGDADQLKKMENNLQTAQAEKEMLDSEKDFMKECDQKSEREVETEEEPKGEEERQKIEELKEGETQEELKEVEEIKEEVKMQELQENEKQEGIEELKEEDKQEKKVEDLENEKQEEIEELKEEVKLEELKEVEEIKREDKQEELKKMEEMKKEENQEELKEVEEIKKEEKQEDLKKVEEMKKEEKQEELKEVEEMNKEEKQEELKEMKEEKQEELKEIAEELKQEAVDELKRDEKQHEVEELKKDEKQEGVEELKGVTKQEEVGGLSEGVKQQEVEEIKEEKKKEVVEEELKEDEKKEEVEEKKQVEELKEEVKPVEELRKEEKQQNVEEVMEEKKEEVMESKEEEKQEQVGELNEEEKQQKVEEVKEEKKEEVMEAKEEEKQEQVDELKEEEKQQKVEEEKKEEVVEELKKEEKQEELKEKEKHDQNDIGNEKETQDSESVFSETAEKTEQNLTESFQAEEEKREVELQIEEKQEAVEEIKEEERREVEVKQQAEDLVDEMRSKEEDSSQILSTRTEESERISFKSDEDRIQEEEKMKYEMAGDSSTTEKITEILSEDHNGEVAEDESGGAFGLFKNAFGLFGEAPSPEIKESTEPTPSLDTNTGETSQPEASSTPEQDSTIASSQVYTEDTMIQPSSASLTQTPYHPSSPYPNKEASLKPKTPSKHYKTLLVHMSADDTAILEELFGRHKLEFLDFILGGSEAVTKDPESESILFDIETLLHHQMEMLFAPSMRLTDSPQEDKEKTRTLIVLQKLQMLLERVKQAFNTGDDSRKTGDSSVGVHDNIRRDEEMKEKKERDGKMSGDTGKEKKSEKGGGKEERVSTEEKKVSQPGSLQQLGDVMKQILDFAHQTVKDSSTHARAVAELLIWLTVQVVSSLPDDIRPGPDLYGVPWEPVIFSSLLGLVTMLLFSCRCYSSVKSRLYRSKERWLAEQFSHLLEEKCKVLETLSKCQQEYDELETSLRDSGVLAQTQKTEHLEVKATQLEHAKRELERDMDQLKDQLDQQKEHRIEQENRIAALEESMKTCEEEAKNLQSQEEQAQTTLKVYSMNSDRLQRNLETAGEEKALLQESNAQLQQQVEGWAERVSELEEEMRRCEAAHNGMMQDVANKDERIISLTDRLLRMKAWDSDLEEGGEETSNGTAGKGEENGKGDDSQSHLQKVQKLIYAAKLNADLKSVDEDKDRVFAKLNDEVKAKEELEGSIKELEDEQLSLQSDSENYTDQVQRLQQKLNIMTEMYQENELKLHRLLTVEEKERLQKEEKLNKADKNIALAMEELQNYRRRAEEMEEELEKTKQAYQTQISAHEKKAHNNWLAARAADRELSDIRRENGLFRQKLTDTQFKLDALDKDPYALDSLARPLPFRAERSPYGPSPLGRPASETRAFLSPPTLMEGPPARLSPRVEPPGGQGEMERSGGPHSDSGSMSPTWDRDRRGHMPGPPGPLGPPGYMFPEPGGPMYRRPVPPPGAMGILPPPGSLPHGPPLPHPRGLPLGGPPSRPHPADMADGPYRENSLGPGEQDPRESGPGDRRTPPEADPRMGGPPMGPMDGPFPRRAPYGPPDFYPPRGPGGPPMMPMWAPPPPGMMFPPRFPPGGPPHPHMPSYGHPMRAPPPDGLPPPSMGPPPTQSHSPEEHTPSPQDMI
ncbi:cTAGE family member 5 isoform X2 [Scomber scombrus]|uniref:cTAGE family member 5 isoform X2 n=1 Tax=Scomber scombrus TaxID=13677 RepID=UPI002DD8C261|nr:cTAGE family member 5 isoform X2 [Scomber scombrus]